MFGTVFRSIVVIGAVYALSPSRDESATSARIVGAEPSARIADVAARAAPSLDDLVAAAGRLCIDDPAACAGAAKAVAGVAAGVAASSKPASAGAAPPKPDGESLAALLEAASRLPARPETKNRAN
jgi:hypothetical protein